MGLTISKELANVVASAKNRALTELQAGVPEGMVGVMFVCPQHDPLHEPAYRIIAGSINDIASAVANMDPTVRPRCPDGVAMNAVEAQN